MTINEKKIAIIRNAEEILNQGAVNLMNFTDHGVDINVEDYANALNALFNMALMNKDIAIKTVGLAGQPIYQLAPNKRLLTKPKESVAQ